MTIFVCIETSNINLVARRLLIIALAPEVVTTGLRHIYAFTTGQSIAVDTVDVRELMPWQKYFGGLNFDSDRIR